MLDRLELAQQKWGGSHTVIDRWLDERQELIVLYCQLAGLKPFERSNKAMPTEGAIQQFCQVLLDYVSAGHFEIYENIIAECDKHGPTGRKLAEKLTPSIVDTTDVALAFNDHYAEHQWDDDEASSKFDVELNRLGEALELRFELEDQLIHNLSTFHSEVPA